MEIIMILSKQDAIKTIDLNEQNSAYEKKIKAGKCKL